MMNIKISDEYTLILGKHKIKATREDLYELRVELDRVLGREYWPESWTYSSGPAFTNPPQEIKPFERETIIGGHNPDNDGTAVR